MKMDRKLVASTQWWEPSYLARKYRLRNAVVRRVLKKEGRSRKRVVRQLLKLAARERMERRA